MWVEKLEAHFPEEIAERTRDLAPPCFYGLYETQGEDDFLKLFVAIDADALQKGHPSGMRSACCLLDGPPEREKKEFEAAWNGYLRCYNLFQFLEHALFSTQEGKASGQPYEILKEKREMAETRNPDAWLEVKTFTAPRLHALIDGLAKSGWPVPEAGFELEADTGEIIGEAELAWEGLKIALLEPNQKPFKGAFLESGWRIFEIEAVLAHPDILRKDRENRG